MNSEASCDTEDWSIAAYYLCHHRNIFHLKNIKLEKSFKICNNISQYYFLCFCSLGEQNKLILKTWKKPCILYTLIYCIRSNV